MKAKMILAAALVAICGASAQAKTHEIKMLNMSKDGPMGFEPAYLKAAPGDSVKFVPTDKAHSSSSVEVPAGAKPWNGKVDEAITVKLDKEGVYVYTCTPHAAMNMTGIIQVGKPTNLDAAKAAVEKVTAAAAMNKDRLKKHLAEVK